MAKINRITRGSSSLVTLAELQSGSQLFTKTVINKTQITPELRDNNVLVKRAELVRRVIDHIVYADRVSGVQVFAEYLLPVDSPLLLFIRGRFVNDTVSVTDDDAFLVPGKGFGEILQATDERLQLLIQAFRLFQDAVAPQSQTALRLDKPLPTDTVSAQDLPSLEPGLNIFDSLLASDVSRILVAFSRLFQHAVQTTDLESFNIGKALVDVTSAQEDPVFSLGKVLADAVAEIDNVALRAAILKQDSIAFADRTTLSSALGKFDDVATLDQLFKAVSITKADAVVVEDQSSRVPGKGLVDQSDIADRLAQQVIKALADVATAIDLAGVFDGITYSYGLSRAFSVDATDQLRLATTYFRTLDPDAVSLLDVLRLSQGYGVPLFDDQTVLDRNQLLIGLGPRDSQELVDQLTRTIVTSRLFQDEEITEDRKALFLDKALLTDAVSFTDLVLAILFKLISLTDSQTVTDANRLDIGLGKADEQTTADQTSRLLDKVLADANDLQDFSRLDVVKNLADTAITLDLAGVFDGITYSYGLNRSEDIFVADADRFTRIFNAQRVFEDDEIIQDEFRRVFGVNIFLTDTQDQPTDLVSLEPGKGFLDRVGEFTVYIDSPQDILYDRELGQNFTSSQLFTLTSVTTDVAVTSSGTGAGQFEGFYAPAIASVGPGTGNPAGGNYVLFTGSGSRSLTTVPLDTTTGQTVVFTYIAGNTSNGGDRPEAGENLILEYSTDLGTSFTTTATIWTGATLWPDGANWRTTSIAMPAASKTTATLWRWRQTGSPTTNADNYGLFNIYVGGTSVAFVGIIPDADFYRMTKGLRENVDQPDSVRRAHTARRREADLLDLRTPDFQRISTSVTSSFTTNLAVSLNTPTRPTIVSNSSLWYDLAALTTSVFVISRSDSSWGMRSTSIGATWSPIDFGFGSASFKFASDSLVGNTSLALQSATVGPFKSTNQGASWASATSAINVNGTQYYLPHWDSNRRIFIAFHRRSIPPSGKGATNYAWRYDYSNNQLNSWNSSTVYIGPSTSFPDGDFPVGVASGIVIGNGLTALVNLSGQTWSLNSSVSVGTAFTNRGNNFPGWPGEISGSYLDNNLLTFGLGGLSFDGGQFVFVYPASGGPVWRTTSTTLSSWYSSTLVGAAAPQEIFWDTSLSRYVIVGELSAGVPIVWTSTNAATWTSSTSTTGSVFVDGAVIRAALVPGATTSGTSTLVGFELSTTISSVLVIPLSVVNVFTTSFSTSVTNLPTPRGAELPSSTRYTVNKSARAGQQYTINFKDRDGSTSTIITDSSVALTYTSSDTDRVGTVDTWRRLISANRLIEDAAPPLDAERFTLIKPISSVNIVAGFGAGNFGQRVSGDDLERTAFNINKSARRSVAGSLLVKTQEGSLPFVQFTTSVTTSLSTGTTSDASIGSLGSTSGVFTDSNIWDSGIGIVNRTAGTGSGSTGGFAIYEHFFFTTTVTRTLTTKSFSQGINSVTFRHIAGSGVNGGEQPDTNGEQLILQYLSSSTGTWVTATTINLVTTNWTLTSVALLFQPTRIRLAQLNCTTGANENYGVASFSAVVTTIEYSTSVTTSLITTANFRESSVLISQSAQDRDAVGVIDFWTSATDYKRGFEEQETPALDNIAKLLIPATLTDTVSVEDSYSLVTDGLTYDGTKIVRDAQLVSDDKFLFINIDAKAGTASTVSGITVQARDRDQIFVGQQYGNIRFSGDAQERISFAINESLNSTPVLAGINYDQRSADLERSFFTIAKLATVGTDPVTAGFGTGLFGVRVSGSDAERIGFNVGLRAKQGANVTVSGVTVAASSTNDTIRVGQQFGIIRFSGDAQERISLDVIKGISSIAVLAGSGLDRARGNILERLVFSITKRIGDSGDNVIPDDFLQTIDGLTYRATTLLRDSSTAGIVPAIGIRVTGSPLENTAFNFSLRAKQGTNVTVSGVTVAATSTTEIIRAGQQYGLIRFSGDAQERISFAVTKPVTSAPVLAGADLLGNRHEARSSSETTIFFVGKRATLGTDPLSIGFGSANSVGLRVSGDDLERTSFNVGLRAYRGVAGQVETKFVDGTANANFSSALISVGTRSADIVGTIDLFFGTFISGRILQHSVSVGRSIDNGTRLFNPAVNPETVSFAITKLIGDGVVPDDFLQTFDGLTYQVAMLERDSLTAGIVPAIGIRVTGSTLENTAFDFSLRAKQGANVTVSGVTVAASSTNDTIRVGQQFGIIRFSGDQQERISFAVTKPITSTPVLAGADSLGSRHEARSSSETTVFTVGKRATVGTDPVTAGFGTGLFGVRVSGDDLERTSFNFSLRAKQGANVTVSGVTIAASSTNDTIRAGQQFGIIRFSGDQQERISLDVFKSLEAGSNTAVLIATDVFRRVSNFRPRFEEEQFALGQKEGNFRYALTQGTRREDLLATDDIIISNLLFRSAADLSGDLDPFGNINTMVSNGSLRMTDYVDIEYLENDYVGESRSFS